MPKVYCTPVGAHSHLTPFRTEFLHETYTTDRGAQGNHISAIKIEKNYFVPNLGPKQFFRRSKKSSKKGHFQTSIVSTQKTLELNLVLLCDVQDPNNIIKCKLSLLLAI